ncbi:hypothetical protein BDB00DRAFT_541934 [Zychaea mexicana]|uniref:uncharacterized protein n=1 Tax=Zychaea mexicana TaxID=64656 RepID=UPI0022FDCEC7|nr:uncharacterized protein BDB00DRAFT_541934 [Zychaea mexicana]KAI9497828.1 hypothetical protein BDB00DRAFT_541934 [Zychaea mexicana]
MPTLYIAERIVSIKVYEKFLRPDYEVPSGNSHHRYEKRLCRPKDSGLTLFLCIRLMRQRCHSTFLSLSIALVYSGFLFLPHPSPRFLQITETRNLLVLLFLRRPAEPVKLLAWSPCR